MRSGPFIIEACLTERPGQEREIEISRPGGAEPWRVALPAALDGAATLPALVRYVAGRYFAEAGDEALRAGHLAVVAVVWLAVGPGTGRVAEPVSWRGLVAECGGLESLSY